MEGAGNFAVSKYYKLPFRPFYRHKFQMMIDMIHGKKYNRILDFGAGSGIFREELLRHSNFVTCVDRYCHPLWRFDAIFCASVLEFCDLSNTLRQLHNACVDGGALYVASPMDTKLSRLYFKIIGNREKRHTHKKIMKAVRDTFKIVEYKEWLNLYFAIKAIKF